MSQSPSIDSVIVGAIIEEQAAVITALKSALAAAQAEVERLKGESLELGDQRADSLTGGLNILSILDRVEKERDTLKRELEAICAIVTSDENTSALHAVEKYAAEKLCTERELEEARAEKKRAEVCSHCGEEHSAHVGCRSDWTGTDRHGR